MKSTIPNQKRGSILVIVMVIVVTVTLLVAALLRLGSFSEIETIKQLRNTQAHWLAEAGLERALSWVMVSKDYRDSLPDTLSDALGMGSYSVDISSTPSLSGSAVAEYTIQSTGTVSNNALGATSIVQVEFDGAPGIPNAITVPGDSPSTFSANTTIDGDIFSAGELDVANGRQNLGGTIEAQGGITGNTGAVTEGDLPDPAPGPWVDPADYDDTVHNNPLEIASRTNAPAIQVDSTGNYTDPFNLSGDTIYINGNIILDADVTGSGTIVANGTVSFGSNGVDIDNDVTIIAAGDISVDKNNTTLGENVQLITMTDFHLSNNQSYPNQNVAIIAIGNITVEANMDGFEGIIYAGGKVTFANGNQEISGTIIAWGGIDLGSNADITYDSDVFNNVGSINYGNNLIIDEWQWQEL